MLKFFVWMNLAFCVTNLLFFAFGSHHWWSIAAAVINANGAAYCYYAWREQQAIQAEIDRFYR